MTGSIKDKEVKASGYECYTSGRQHSKSNNFSYLPQDKYVACPITGRRIVKK